MSSTPHTDRGNVSPAGISRRRMLGAAVGAGTAAPLLPARPARAAAGATRPATIRPTSARLVLPRPTGPHPVGTVDLTLVDPTRPGPTPGSPLRLMASLWYPARPTGHHPLAPWMGAGALRAFLASGGFPPSSALGPLTAGHLGAPVHRPGHSLPVVVHSHGAHDHRSDTTIVVQELASHGYLVVTVDHANDSFTQFPDGRVLTPDGARMPGAAGFAEDVRFLLDRIEELAAGRNPDADGRQLPEGLGAALDLDRIGMFGWSKGGAATALTMAADRRVKAGLALDGTMDPVITGDLDRPFMLLTARCTRTTQRPVAEFWSRLKGWRLDVRAAGAAHASYTDVQYLAPQLARLAGLSDAQLRSMTGTLDPGRAVRIQQAYPLAFFDRHLRRRPSRLLDGPSAAFPEVAYLP
ncbi:alpha/beta hydrolase family protein [Kitasatospora viridis]|uniref:Platelet-activating factor acetylhydrolase isoform II n=1 Tax=Kitasatospora viridis TaxID=281105 RepID=A0A561TUW8_9ACTN|nr:acetylhydrolase [Kitasatospora viridis]TWF90901.1 platelet-activating factor acetylhydrolase isoform II [Kitasatospora viridis]